MAKKGILLVNLGSPKSTSVKDVKQYLDEFLMDERVIDYRWIFRALLVKGIILNTRPKKSAKAYETVWTDEGSPLIVITEKIQRKLQKLMEIPVEIGMRYSEPSIENGLKKLIDQGVSEIVLFPLYPQYAMSTTESVIEKAEKVRKNKFPDIKISYIQPFYNKDVYIECLTESIREKLPKDFDVLQFSYHGVPERHIYKTDPTKTCNLNDCCFRENNPSHQFCYRHQCFETTTRVIEKLNLPREKTIITFQSRLGKDKWIEPYTDETLKLIPSKGVKKLAVVCPAFVSDCLETLEEIAQEGKEIFIHGGGDSFHYIPCLNDQDRWIDVIKKLCEKKLKEFYFI
ncbi:ferrochelatase [Elizabethkingia meningoseptica]|uniref:Ferrochelatase n=1 Tax=Elizabethkingia meningoseptica TaxID=238 RepID=A0A1V3TWL4_ELIME|nr:MULTISPECIES: ferrochelatase [Elizabethkingia]AQX12705.1 ferrochelatase [Elizabethkingia meningoseptica]MBG0514217.1 ferrochelatase [Elizabethkingia meningoseptica]MDE5433134.1 ferrochelatase [Elizabethkingia meningoseptica]MDE5447448.1 ferrochelatase [Elizabethkingia meningoseptica]MDE5471502.1 ferrochelatase [Elizabethkingia meningoseptica]